MPPGERMPEQVGIIFPSGVTRMHQPRQSEAGAGGTGEAEGDPGVAVLVRSAAEGVFVVVPIDSPLGADGFENVRRAVAVGVLEAGNLGALGEVEPAVFPIHAEGLVQALGEFFPSDVFQVVLISAGADPEVAAAGGDGDLLLRHQRDGADFHDLAGWQRDFLADVEVGLLRRVGEGGGEE